MRLKEDRTLAAIVLAVVVVASIFLGGGHGLNRERASVTRQFDAASESISAELKELSGNAQSILTIARDYETDANLSALSDALEALNQADAIAGKSEARRELNGAVEEVYASLSAKTLKGTQSEDLRYAYKNYTSANLRISHDPYNEAAAAFNRLRGGFPARLIAASRGIAPLDIFE